MDVVYVSDILLTCNDPHTIDSLKAHLHSTFSIKDMGHLNYFLGSEVGYQLDGITLSQNEFTKELFSSSGISSFMNVVTPFPHNTELSAYTGDLFL